MSGAEQALHVAQALVRPLVGGEDEVVVELGGGLHPGADICKLVSSSALLQLNICLYLDIVDLP